MCHNYGGLIWLSVEKILIDHQRPARLRPENAGCLCRTFGYRELFAGCFVERGRALRGSLTRRHKKDHADPLASQGPIAGDCKIKELYFRCERNRSFPVRIFDPPIQFWDSYSFNLR